MLVAGEVICGLPWGVFQVRHLNRLVFRVSRLEAHPIIPLAIVDLDYRLRRRGLSHSTAWIPQ